MFGTHSVTDLQSVTNQSVAEFGEDKVAKAVTAELAAHNTLVEEMLRELCSFGSEQISLYGKSTDITVVETDEFGDSDAQKTGPPTNIGWPLKHWDATLQWSRLWMLNNTPAELVTELNAAKAADLRKIQAEIRNALYNSANNLTYIDVRSKNRAVLPIRALLNADGSAIPVGPNGETFVGASHTHYLGTGSLIAANISGLIETVIEHKAEGAVRLYINRANEAAIRGMTGNFTAYVDSRIVPGSGTAVGVDDLKPANLYNRAIGMFDGAEVWVKPWVLASYPVAIRVNSEGKPLRARTRTGSLSGMGAFELRYDNESYPLRAEVMSREMGIGVDDRAAAAVLYTGNATYAVPTYG